ncbi:amidohydrolase family protein [Rhodococcus pseudokoreensis]|uniref:amidohydrolase family protein n=1 Tax=Rhodococcus pseudokoreensis TaxID=2811421 RepID=UPI001F128B38|nr:amidohydrolase family protein [Rhodococcus pseudokoreensis]
MTSGAQALVDVHPHFVTDRYVTAARAAGHHQPDGMPGWPSWNVADHLALMDEGGIGTAMLSVSSPGTHFGDDRAARDLTREVNEYAADLVRRHPGRFGHFASLPLPDVDSALLEIGYALDVLGSDGVAVETNAHGLYLGDTRFDPVWVELDRRRAVVFVHPTSPPGHESVSLGRPRPMLEFVFDSARAVSDLVFTGVLLRYPNIEWVFTHGGGALPLLADRMELFRGLLPGHDPSVPPVPDQLRRLWFDLAGTPLPYQIPALTAAFGSDRVLYGSDYCWTPASATAHQLASVDTWRTVTTDNAHRLFPRLAAHH